MLLKISAGAGFSLRVFQSLRSILFEGLGDINYIGGAEVLPAPLEPYEETCAIDELGTERENEILMHLRRTNKTRYEVSIDEPLNVDWDGNELLLSDVLGTDEDVVYKNIEDEVEIGLLNKAIDKLSGRERTIISLRFGLDNPDGTEMTQKEVANLLGISQSYISRLEKKIIKRLKKEINNFC